MPAVLAKKKRPTAKRSRKSSRAVAAVAGQSSPAKESREEWLRRLRTEYTPQVCEQTLALNESLPVHGEP